MTQLYSTFGAQTSFLEPEILTFEKGTTVRFIANEPRLKKYEFYPMTSSAARSTR